MHVLLWQYLVVLISLGLWRSEHELIAYLFADGENWPFLVWFVILAAYALIRYWIPIQKEILKTVDNYITVAALLFLTTILGIAQFNYIDTQPSMSVLDFIALLYIIAQTLLFVIFIKRPPKNIERIEMPLSLEMKAGLIGGAIVATALLYALVNWPPIQLTILLLALGTAAIQLYAKKNPAITN